MSVNGTKTDETKAKVEREPYRPKASVTKVREMIANSLRDIVSTASHEAGTFAHLAWCDRDKDATVVYGHLVDASECLEIAMTHLSMLKCMVVHEMQTAGQDSPF